MSLLDRLKPQPKWRHADPQMRIAAVQEIDADQADAAEILIGLARSDPDARVRRAAVARLEIPAVLAELAKADADESVREQAIEGLLEMASAPDAAAAEQAVENLYDPRHLATVAKSCPHQAARLAALARISDGRTLASIARHAQDPLTALKAADRVSDPSDLMAVAATGEHRDAGLVALERLAAAAPGDRGTLEAIASRAANKAVARRARALIQAIDDAEAARRAAEEEQRRQEEDAREAARRQAEEAEALVRQAEEAAERARLAGARAQVISAREQLCARVEAMHGDDALEQLALARAEWEGLPALQGEEPDAARLEQRFARAAALCEGRVRERTALQPLVARLEELAGEAERSAGGVEGALPWNAVRAEWRDLKAAHEALFSDPSVQALEARFGQVEQALAERERTAREAEERVRREHLLRLQQLCARVSARVGAENLTAREAERALRDMKAALDELPALPSRRDAELITEELRRIQAALTPRARELRELEEWKRFANAQVQEELCGRVEALLNETDLEKAARELREIQARWKDVAEAPRAHAQALWRRYRRAADELRARCDVHFKAQAEVRLANLKAREALCERAEALAGSSDWIRTAEEIKKLQAEWKAIGAVPRQQAQALWKRFRAACDQFFTRRHEDLARRKETWAANLARKEALCARAEALAESSEWEAAAAELRRLQADWKTVGPVKKNRSEAIWQRFRAACDKFFERYKHRDQIETTARAAAREALVVDLEALASVDPPDPALASRVQALRARWNQAPPLPRDTLEPLAARFTDALWRLIGTQPDAFRGTDLDPQANRRKMEQLCARVEGLLDRGAAASSPSEALATMLREALAANTIGGRASEESKWRAMAEEVKQAQSAWQRIGPVPPETAQELTRRFQLACTRFFDQQRRRTPTGAGTQR
jgi:hypothetical protein